MATANDENIKFFGVIHGKTKEEFATLYVSELSKPALFHVKQHQTVNMMFHVKHPYPDKRQGEHSGMFHVKLPRSARR